MGTSWGAYELNQNALTLFNKRYRTHYNNVTFELRQ